MRSLDYSKAYSGLLTPEIVSYMTQIHELKGKQAFFIKEYRNYLTKLLETSRIQSIEASSRIEGLTGTYDRFKKLALNKTTPRNQSEREIAGYRDALLNIRENHKYISLGPSSILQLHRELYKFNTSVVGGSFRSIEAASMNERTARVSHLEIEPAPCPDDIPRAVKELCHAFSTILKEAIPDPLLVIPMFILDFLRIQPFYTGNRYMSRLLALLLLYQSGYIVFDYISLEKLIADSSESYYKALQDDSETWKDVGNDYMPFVRYWLGIVLTAFQEFYEQVETQFAGGLSKADRIQNIFRNTTGSITKTELMAQCPDISQKTIERTLSDLLSTNRIIKIGGGRYTSYTLNREDNNP